MIFAGLWCLAAGTLAVSAANPTSRPVIETDVAVPMRDGVVLRADVWRPAANGRFPVLVHRTPYDKREAVESSSTHLRAIERGYAVVLQDVRGRHASQGEFVPYRNEGRDGYDTIEWAAAQPWSDGRVGTYGLSYPGAVQWLAAVESPPHLRAMVPAMTFSTPRNFFYSGGVFDGSWLEWILVNIAPDIRVRKDLPGPRDRERAVAEWERFGDDLQQRLPLSAVPELRDVAPFFFEWLRHPPHDPWWDWAEIRGRYEQVDAAVLNLSGWYDEAYGPEGAATNFNGLMAARRDHVDPRTRLVIGPWVHGIAAIGRSRTGDLQFGPEAAIDYDELVLRWMDRHLKGVHHPDLENPVRVFVMGRNQWRDLEAWPPPSAEPVVLYLSREISENGRRGQLVPAPPRSGAAASLIRSDPRDPVRDPYPDFGPHDYGPLSLRDDVLLFDSAPLDRDTEVTGAIAAEVSLSCDCQDTDLWVKLLDVHSDGKAYNLMSPGLDLLRASYREPAKGPQPLEPGRPVLLRFGHLMTSHLFREGHRIRILISTSFFPRFSRNLHTGASETDSAQQRTATVTVHHDPEYPSRLILPVMPPQSPRR